MSKIVHRVGDMFRFLLGAAVALMLGVIIMLVFIQVLARYITHTSTFEIAEICRVLLIWLVFCGAALLVSQRKLILIDFVHGRLRKGSSATLDIVTDIVTIIFLAAFATFAFELIEVVKLKTAPATGLSYRWFYMAPIVFSAFGIYFTIERLLFGPTKENNAHNSLPEGIHAELKQ
jgi:TRAP-type C4-dicarboxylate transport system permease small subunit